MEERLLSRPRTRAGPDPGSSRSPRGRMSEIGKDIDAAVSRWMPDGERVFYNSRSGQTYWEKVDGSGEREPLLDARASGDGFFVPETWSLDGRMLIGWGRLTLGSGGGQSENGLTVLHLDPENPSEVKELIPIRDPMQRSSLSLSPDGRWLAYTETEAGRHAETRQIWVTSYPEGDKRLLVSTDYGDDVPIWSPDGKRIFFRRAGELMVVDVQTKPDLSASPSRPVLKFGGGGQARRVGGFLGSTEL